MYWWAFTLSLGDGCFQAYLSKHILFLSLLLSNFYILYLIIWAVSLLTINLRAYSLLNLIMFLILRFLNLNTFRFYLKITIPRNIKINRSTSIDFVENQLSRSLISLSPLITTHLRILQHSRVRSSNRLDLQPGHN
jgi:hypothetical protein